LKTNHKRLLLGLVTAAVLLPGAASAAPLNAVLAPRDPAVEPVSLDETALAAGSRPGGETGPGQEGTPATSRKLWKKRTIGSTGTQGTKSFLERLREKFRGHGDGGAREEAGPEGKPAKLEKSVPPEKPALDEKTEKPEKQARDRKP
jgi:hypothetical protein